MQMTYEIMIEYYKNAERTVEMFPFEFLMLQTTWYSMHFGLQNLSDIKVF